MSRARTGGLRPRRLPPISRDALDHRFLDEINDLGPGTMENLCAYIWRKLEDDIPALYSVAVLRDSTEDRVTYFGEAA